MPSRPLTEPIPKFIVERRISALGGFHAVADRLGMPVRAARAVLLSERPLPTWVYDALFFVPEPDPEEDGPEPKPSPAVLPF